MCFWPWWWSSGQRACLLSDEPSSNPAKAYSFSVILCLKRTKINRKRPGLPHFKNFGFCAFEKGMD